MAGRLCRIAIGEGERELGESEGDNKYIFKRVYTLLNGDKGAPPSGCLVCSVIGGLGAFSFVSKRSRQPGKCPSHLLQGADRICNFKSHRSMDDKKIVRFKEIALISYELHFLKSTFSISAHC